MTSRNLTRDIRDDELIVLIPTTGNILKLGRSLRSLNSAAQLLGVNLKVLLSFNVRSLSQVTHQFDFSNLSIENQYLEEFQDSAEESTLEALKKLKTHMPTNDYIWILGDDDVVLVDGLRKLLETIDTGNFEVIFHNSHQMTQNGKILNGPFIHSATSTDDIDFVEFALKCGINYSPTGFGRLIFRMGCLTELEFWEELIREGGPIFSYVTYFMFTLKSKTMHYETTPLITYRQNAYHEGVHDMWKKYSERRKQLEYAPWTSELIGQLQLLHKRGVVSLSQVAKSTIIERDIGYRFPFVLLEQLHQQMRAAILEKSQIPNNDYMKICTDYICLIASDLIPIVEQIENLYSMINRHPRKTILLKEWNVIQSELARIRSENPYQGLIVDYYYGYTIAKHLDGFVATGYHPISLAYAYKILHPKDQDLVLFAPDLNAIRKKILIQIKSKETSYPENLFSWAYRSSNGDSTNLSPHVLKILKIQLAFWNRLPLSIKSFLKKVL